MPKPKRIRNLLKSINGSSSHASSSLDASLQPSFTPTDPVQPSLIPNDPVQPSLTPNDPVHTPVVDNEVSQLPNQTLSQPTQQETQSSKCKAGRESNPEELAGLFPNCTQQASDVGSGASSPNNIRRSSGGSNTHLVDHQSPPNGS